MSKSMKTSGAETLSSAANIFVGQTEAPLMVKPFIAAATNSELMAIMVGGFANHLQTLALLRRHGRLQHHVRHADDGVHGRPDFMAHVRQKRALGLIRCLRRFFGLL